MDTIIKELHDRGYEIVKTKTLHESNSSFYQLIYNGKVYPTSRGNKQDIGHNTITTCYRSFGINGVLKLFAID